MYDVFIGLAIFGIGLIVGVVIGCILKVKAQVTVEKEEGELIIEPLAKRFYDYELAEEDNPEEEDSRAKRRREEDLNFFS